MDHVKPADLVTTMVETATRKARLGVGQLLLRGMLSGALLGIATSLAVGANIQTGQPLIGGLVFPVGVVMIFLLGLELVTGSFGILPLVAIDGRGSYAQVFRNFAWVFFANLLGSLLYAILLVAVLTNGGMTPPSAVGQAIVKIAEAKTIGYAAAGSGGLLAAFVKGMLCNWMVCLGLVMSMISTSTVGKIAAAWLPIVIFFAQGFEHSVVNMFVIPAGMLMGANVSFADWWLWNQIPVTLGNLVGGFVLTGGALYFAFRDRPEAKPHLVAGAVPAEKAS